MKAFGVFQGGGAKGYAHIGALQAIEARGIELAAVAGSSVGAVIALLVAAGYSGTELFRRDGDKHSGLLAESWLAQLNATDWEAFQKFRGDYFPAKTAVPSPGVPKVSSSKLSWGTVAKTAWSAIDAFWRHKHVVNQVWEKFGVTDSVGFRKWLDVAVRTKLGIVDEPIRFRMLKIPLKVVAGDLLTGQMRVFGGAGDEDLDAVDAAVASASFPLFFQPYPFQTTLFVDGGLLSNLPAWVFDDERLKQSRSIPTFGFRLTEVPLLGARTSPAAAPTSFPSFLKQLVHTSIFGGQDLGARGIDEYYCFDLPADIDTLAFHEIDDKASSLVEAGRDGVAAFFETQIGPSDPDEMEAVLTVVANFARQALDRYAKQRLPLLRAFILIQSSEEIVKVAYSANATDDGDDRLKFRISSPGPAAAFLRKEPLITYVPEIPEKIRANALLKYEHVLRPKQVVTSYSIPIFKNPDEWRQTPTQRSRPIGALLIDSSDDLRYLLQRPELEDRLATYAQICGEYLRGQPSDGEYAAPAPFSEEFSDSRQLDTPGFYVSERTTRSPFYDSETKEMVERIDMRILDVRATGATGASRRPAAMAAVASL